MRYLALICVSLFLIACGDESSPSSTQPAAPQENVTNDANLASPAQMHQRSIVVAFGDHRYAEAQGVSFQNEFNEYLAAGFRMVRQSESGSSLFAVVEGDDAALSRYEVAQRLKAERREQERASARERWRQEYERLAALPWDEVKVGMTLEEVTALLGEPRTTVAPTESERRQRALDYINRSWQSVNWCEWIYAERDYSRLRPHGSVKFWLDKSTDDPVYRLRVTTVHPPKAPSD